MLKEITISNTLLRAAVGALNKAEDAGNTHCRVVLMFEDDASLVETYRIYLGEIEALITLGILEGNKSTYHQRKKEKEV